MGLGSFQKLGGVVYPQGGVIVFPWRGACISQEKWLLSYGAISQHGQSSSHSFMPLPQASYSRLSSYDCRPFWPPFSQAKDEWPGMWNLCICPLEQNKEKKRKKGGFVSSKLLSLVGKKPCELSPLGVVWTGDPNTGSLCLGSQSEVLSSLLTRGSSLSHVVASVATCEIGASCLSWKWYWLLSHPCLFSSHVGVSSHSWFNISCLGSA